MKADLLQAWCYYIRVKNFRSVFEPLHHERKVNDAYLNAQRFPWVTGDSSAAASDIPITGNSSKRES